jgi:hypothetical protein
MKLTRTTKLIILICTLLQATLSVTEITLKYNKSIRTTFTHEAAGKAVGKAVTIQFKYGFKRIQISTNTKIGEDNFTLLDDANKPIKGFCLAKEQIDAFRDRDFVLNFEAKETETKVNYEPLSKIMNLKPEDFPTFILPEVGELSFYFETEGYFDGNKIYMKYLPNNDAMIIDHENIYLLYNNKKVETVVSTTFEIFVLQTYWNAIGEGAIKDERMRKPLHNDEVHFKQRIKNELCNEQEKTENDVEISEDARSLICPKLSKRFKRKLK